MERQLNVKQFNIFLVIRHVNDRLSSHHQLWNNDIHTLVRSKQDLTIIINDKVNNFLQNCTLVGSVSSIELVNDILQL